MTIQLRKVLISDEIDDICLEILRKNGVEVVKNCNLSKEDLLKEIAGYDGLIVRSATKVSAEVINAGVNLKIIGRAGTGVDNIDTEVATKKGIIVMNTPGGNTLSAAEHTCTLIIALTRNLGEASKSMKDGKWDRKKFMGTELYGKTLAIIGLGRIGKEVALRMQSFGMTTIGYDPIISSAESATFNTEWMPLEKIWPLADYITVHTPLIPQTKNLINDAVFGKCKKGVKVINVARGGIIDEDALLRALQSGQCGGAGLDVFIEEPPKDYTLAKHPNVIATPHLGASTIEAQVRVAEEIAQQFVDLAQGRFLVGAVNANALTNALNPALRPWIQLAEKLGTVGSQLTKTLSVNNVEVLIYENSLEAAGSALVSSVMIGYLNTSLAENGDILPKNLNIINSPIYTKQSGIKPSEGGETIEKATFNLINAPVLAKQAGIVTTSTNKCKSGQLKSGITVEFQSAGGEVLEICGVIAGEHSLLTSVQANTFKVAASLHGETIVYRVDKPVSLADIISAAEKDGLKVSAISASEVKHGQGFGIINLELPVTQGLNHLNQTVNSAYVCSL
ncbi:D-3-phosphoglycerate dehydrogenase-like isoform X1 [Biomphalaria pfeifferi]|uniref:D-3-phosphoglycerate dehydrogenase-like isoform X1 n=1 Tax=Biomphalaria pfeifferi TaxID=112525 RepID=A0AAD8F5Z4_BIOPF|nr:D-3-phosphoglycerate dehydrogenase-like isoform X1 [Biomphalaria pfeifferi]